VQINNILEYTIAFKLCYLWITNGENVFGELLCVKLQRNIMTYAE